MHISDHLVLRALQAGIRGYVVKTQAAKDLVDAIEAVNRGEMYLSPVIPKTVAERCLASGVPPRDPSTPGEARC